MQANNAIAHIQKFKYNLYLKDDILIESTMDEKLGKVLRLRVRI